MEIHNKLLETEVSFHKVVCMNNSFIVWGKKSAGDLRNISKLNGTEYFDNIVDVTKPLPEPMLTHIYVAIGRH